MSDGLSHFLPAVNLPSLGALLLTALGLAMDAFAVSLATGIACPRMTHRQGLRLALCFGGFQGLMPLLGALVGAAFSGLAGAAIQAWDHWIALLLLGGIGAKMLHEAWEGEKDGHAEVSSRNDGASAGEIERRQALPAGGPALGALLLLGLATSVDAFAAGLTLDAMGIPRLLGVTVIAVITFALCWPAAVLGARFASALGAIGPRLARQALFAGGAALWLVGAHIVYDHISRGV